MKRWVALLLLLVGCATVQKTPGVCTEFEHLRCLGEPICAYDEHKHCQVCECPNVLTPTGPTVPTTGSTNRPDPTRPPR